MFINELKGVMSKEAIKKVASERNPSNQVGYVKSLYFAYLYLRRENVFNKAKFITAKDIDWKRLEQSITPADLKIAQRQDAQTQKSVDKKRAKEQLKSLITKNTVQKDIPYSTKSSKPVTKTKITSATTKSNNIKKTKTTKKI